jgi:predicted ATP-dependent endonuclease of OLD family
VFLYLNVGQKYEGGIQVKIRKLQISNILSFKYYENISEAPCIEFDSDLNIIIGQNGSGKSTALEVLNFIFKRILFRHFSVNQELYSKRSDITNQDKKGILQVADSTRYHGFRLEPNWNSETQPQKIKLEIQLDGVDLKNIENLIRHKDKISSSASSYTNHTVTPSASNSTQYSIEVTLHRGDRNYSVSIDPTNDPGYDYLVNYNYFKALIEFYNYENPNATIEPLYESFTLIGGYRNYHSFNPSVTIQNQSASQQIQSIITQEFGKSLNVSDQAEPAIFNLVRLRIAGKHFEIYGESENGSTSEELANNQPFLQNINRKLQIVNLKVKIKFTDKQRWGYSFHFYDLKRSQQLSDINSLSAGQKAIIHLVFEAYGRGELKGGLVIIDEPELHLHFQFQNEYLSVISEINKEQLCQYVLVTHSESLINSSTIHRVKRFSLSADNYSEIKSPNLSTNQKTLVKILDNTRSTYAFFVKKVLLVEGETDRYFFKALLQELNPTLVQEIAILDIIGKSNYTVWKEFFESFGLSVYFVGDLDAAFGFLYPSETAYKLLSPEIIAGFKCTHPDLIQGIEAKYRERIFVLKNGSLEHYLSIHNKGLPETIRFCNESLTSFVQSRNENSMELVQIINLISQNP